MQALADWLERHNIKRSDFAGRVKISPSHLTLVIQGKRSVSIETAQRISEETGGEIGLDNFGAVRRPTEAAPQ